MLGTIISNNPFFAFQVLGEGRIGLIDKKVTNFTAHCCSDAQTICFGNTARSTEFHELGEIFPETVRFGLILTDQ